MFKLEFYKYVLFFRYNIFLQIIIFISPIEVGHWFSQNIFRPFEQKILKERCVKVMTSKCNCDQNTPDSIV